MCWCVVVSFLCISFLLVPPCLLSLPPFILIYLSEVVFRDVPCHSSARPIKHTVMTDWPRSRLITDWLTERAALFCSAVFPSSVCQTFQAQETLNAVVSSSRHSSQPHAQGHMNMDLPSPSNTHILMMKSKIYSGDYNS